MVSTMERNLWPAVDIPSTATAMRAIVFEQPGGPDVVRVREIAVPAAGPGEVVVRVAAAPVFSADLAARSGLLGSMLPPARYHRLGWELAGTVVQTGVGVASYAVGDHVIGLSSPLSPNFGTQADFAVLPADAIASAPANLSAIEASTIPGNGLAAAQALDALGLREGATVAVIGAAGGVGGFAMELAAERGLHPIGIASDADREFVSARGVFIPRGPDPVARIRHTALGGVDGLIDLAGLGPAVIGAVHDDGAFVGLVPPAVPASERGIRVSGLMVHPDGEQLERLSAVASAGRLTIRVARVFQFADAAEAHRLYEQEKPRGRVVLVPDRGET